MHKFAEGATFFISFCLETVLKCTNIRTRQNNIPNMFYCENCFVDSHVKKYANVQPSGLEQLSTGSAHLHAAPCLSIDVLKHGLLRSGTIMYGFTPH